jgi:hypothetical protein
MTPRWTLIASRLRRSRRRCPEGRRRASTTPEHVRRPRSERRTASGHPPCRGHPTRSRRHVLPRRSSRRGAGHRRRASAPTRRETRPSHGRYRTDGLRPQPGPRSCPAGAVARPFRSATSRTRRNTGERGRDQGSLSASGNPRVVRSRPGRRARDLRGRASDQLTESAALPFEPLAGSLAGTVNRVQRGLRYVSDVADAEVAAPARRRAATRRDACSCAR